MPRSTKESHRYWWSNCNFSMLFDCELEKYSLAFRNVPTLLADNNLVQVFKTRNVVPEEIR